MMAYELENIAILDIKGVVYKQIFWNLTKNDAINRLNNRNLNDEGTL